jgi:hypothetical protein
MILVVLVTMATQDAKVRRVKKGKIFVVINSFVRTCFTYPKIQLLEISEKIKLFRIA